MSSSVAEVLEPGLPASIWNGNGVRALRVARAPDAAILSISYAT